MERGLHWLTGNTIYSWPQNLQLLCLLLFLGMRCCEEAHRLPFPSESQIKACQFLLGPSEMSTLGASVSWEAGESGIGAFANTHALMTYPTSGCGGDLDRSGWNQKPAF